MAEQKEELIIEINVTKSIENLGLMRQSLDQLIAQREELSEKSKAGDLQSTKALEMLNSTIRNQQLEYKATQRVLDGYVQSKKKEADTIDFANNSINENKALLKQLTAQYNDLKNPSTQATEKIKALSDALKQQESAVGNNTRNVGNYKADIISAAKEIKLFGVNASAIIDPLNKMKLGFSDAGGGVKGLASAFGAGTIGIVISAVQLLINVFQEFGGVADKVEQITAGLSGGFKAFVTGGSAIEAGKAIAALTAEIQLLEEAEARAILTNEQTNASIKHLQVAARDRTKTEGERIGLLKQADALAEKQWRDNNDRLTETALREEEIFEKKNSLTRLEVETAIFSNERIKQMYDFMNDAKIDAVRERVGAVVKLDGEEVKKLIENRVKLEQADEAYTDIVDKNQVRENKLLDDAQAKKDKALAEEKARNEKAAKEREAYVANLAKLETDFYLNERQKLEKSFTDKIATLKGDGERETELRLTIESEKQAALELFDKAAQDKRDQALKLRLEKERAARSEFLSKQLQIDLGYVDLSVATEEDKFKRKQEIQINYLEKQLDNAIQFLGADGSITKAELQGIEAIKLALAKAKAEMFPSKKDEKETFGSALGLDKETLKEISGGLQVAGQVIDGISNIASAATQVRLNEIDAETNAEIEKVNQSTLSEEEKIKKISAINAKANKEKYEAEKAAFETNKALQIVNAIIGTAVGVINAFQLGPIAGAIMAAVIAATGVAQIAVIASQSPPPPPSNFAKGVIGLDGDGSETSDSIPARLSKGESVITAKATKQFHRELAWMEQQVGNIPNYKFGHGNFANGLIGDGGYVARDTVRNADQSLMMSEAIRQGFRDIPSPTLSIVEFQNKVNSRNRSINISEA